ncbi:response regulator transcription factor [Paracoccus marcusii]|uniref:response regulator transcription factor n=1 Tax=Paracoccus marcusii TaxID=59779 RepID=UPI0012F05AD3|nr:response regulator transcription factor [Paracoccus marcusii]
MGAAPALEIEADASILSKREGEIYVLIRQGCCNKEIGRSLNLSEKTVKHYLTNIFRKLDVRNRTELAMHAYNIPTQVTQNRMLSINCSRNAAR